MEADIIKTKDLIIKDLRKQYQKEKNDKMLKALEYYESFADKIKKINIKETFGFFK